MLCHFALRAICSALHIIAHTYIIFDSNVNFTLLIDDPRSYRVSTWLTFAMKIIHALLVRLIRQVNSQYNCVVCVCIQYLVGWENVKKNPIENVLAKSMLVQANSTQIYKQRKRNGVKNAPKVFGNEINDNREWHATFERELKHQQHK